MRFFTIVSLIFAATTGVFASPVVQRDNSPAGVVAILTTLNEQVKPYSNQLTSFTSAEATTDNIKPAVDGISAAVQTAINDLKALKGQSTSVIMASADGDGTASASDVAALLGEALQDIFGGVDEILDVVADVTPAVDELLTAVGDIVNDLLSTVGGLVTEVLGFVGNVLRTFDDVIEALGLTSLYEATLGYSLQN